MTRPSNSVGYKPKYPTKIRVMRALEGEFIARYTHGL